VSATDSKLIAALLDSLDDDSLDELAARLAPHLTALSARVPGRQVRWLSVKEAAALTGLSRRTLYRVIQVGELCAHKPRGRWRIASDELDRWLSAYGATRLQLGQAPRLRRRSSRVRPLRDALERD
jgi:excisionase family DNA binding protein